MTDEFVGGTPEHRARITNKSPLFLRRWGMHVMEHTGLTVNLDCMSYTFWTYRSGGGSGGLFASSTFVL